MATLREIGEDMRALDALLLELGGEVTDEQAEAAIDQWFKDNAHALSKKIDDYATVIREAENRERERRDEAGRLLALAALDSTIQVKLKDRLRFFMEEGGVEEIQGKYHRVRLANNGGLAPMTLLVKDPLALPEWAQKVTVEADTKQIRNMLENHPGMAEEIARLEPRGKHVRIK